MGLLKLKIIVVVLLVTLTGCQCFFHNLLRNFGRTVSGVYQCTRGVVQPPMSMSNANTIPVRDNYDLRIEVKNGRARIWLPGRLYRQMEIPRPFSTESWQYNPVPYYAIMQNRILSDLSSQNRLLPFANNYANKNNENLVEINENENSFPKYPAVVPPPFLLPPRNTNQNIFLQNLTPPAVQNNNENENFGPSLSVPIDFDEINNLADPNNYQTIPFSDYEENGLGNGLMENDNKNLNEVSNKPTFYNPTIPTANIDGGFGQIPLYK